MNFIHLPLAILSILFVLFIVLIRLFIIQRLPNLQTFSILSFMHKNSKKRLFYSLLEKHGLLYHKKQNFYSYCPTSLKSGYCSLYDEQAPFVGTILDREIIPFSYDNHTWILALWKGQYSLSTGFELAIYHKSDKVLDIPDIFLGTYYEPTKNLEFHLHAEFHKNKEHLITHELNQCHLNGFLPGVFSYPEELELYLSITFPKEEMTRSFTKSLLRKGHQPSSISIQHHTVSFSFLTPKESRPLSLNTVTTYLAQKRNRRLCASYQFITFYDKYLWDKIEALQKESPDLYEEFLEMGSKKASLRTADLLNEHLNS